MPIRSIESWSGSLHTNKKHTFEAKAASTPDGSAVEFQCQTPMDEAILRTVLQQCDSLADRYRNVDNQDIDLDPRPGVVLLAKSALAPTPDLYNSFNSAAEKFVFDPESKNPISLSITTETGDSLSLVDWDPQGRVTSVRQERILNTTLLRDEKLMLTVDNSTGAIHYEESTRKRWF